MIRPILFLAGFPTIPRGKAAATLHGMDRGAVRAMGIAAKVGMRHGMPFHTTSEMVKF